MIKSTNSRVRITISKELEERARLTSKTIGVSLSDFVSSAIKMQLVSTSFISDLIKKGEEKNKRKIKE